ncbi:MAG: hypothetical protein M3409_08270, partial [Gemmatimonadota bacterium]|nr:hypothetical protein [Gemmatimonadota bacterium]
MRVFEMAKELEVPAEALVHLLREMEIPVRSHMTALADEHVARLRTVMERQRKSGRDTAGQAVEAALEEAQSGPRRRRRRRSDDAPEAEGFGVEAEASEEDADGTAAQPVADSTASPTADAAEAMAGEAAEAAAERGAELVTSGGEPPLDVTVIVQPPAEEPPVAETPVVESPVAETPAAPVRPMEAPRPTASSAAPPPRAARPEERVPGPSGRRLKGPPPE